MIRTKEDAKQFLKSHKEFTDHDFILGEFWFRYDGIQDIMWDGNLIKGHDYAICHETKGYMGVNEQEAIDYVFRNRKRINNLERDGMI